MEKNWINARLFTSLVVEMNMKICPKCKAENRPEAAFCARCGSILLAQASPAKPGSPKTNATEQVKAQPDTVKIIREPAILPGLPNPQEKLIFGECYQSDGMIYQDEHETRYLVSQIIHQPVPCIRICSNPACRTIHAPTGAELENFCTHCGSPIDQNPPLLVLQEADTDRFGSLQQVVGLHLTHPNVHPPLAIFNQQQPAGYRYYLVTPYSEELPSLPEPVLVLEWGKQLAKSLDYLHSHGIAFGGELDPSIFGLVGNNIVWRNFNTARILPLLVDREKINNIRLLALSLYSMITRKATYTDDDPALSPGLSELFHKALVEEGFTSGAMLAEKIDQTISEGLSPLNLDYHTGRRTHSGLVRSINEDSLMGFTLSHVQQGISKPVGLFAVADGMGGHDTGELASSLSIQALIQKAFSELASLQNLTSEEFTSWLMQAVQAANLKVYEARQNAGSDMGSTLVCVLILGYHAYVAHIGDSRVYLLRDGSIQQLTVDHSLVQHLVNIGQISAEDVRNHPQRNVIYRSLGDKPNVEVDIYSQNLLPEDRLLLCSDGLTGMLDDQTIHKIIQEASSPQTACDQLVEAANQNGGSDNITAIVVEVISA
jgi:PPM family protein phosphatase